MKQILLLFLAMSCPIMNYSQTEIKTSEEPIKVYALDEVELVAYGIKAKKDAIGCGYREVVSTTHTNCTTYCSIRNVLIEATLDKKELDAIKLYPNPSARGIFKIHLDRKYKSIAITVSSITGQVVLSNSYQNSRSEITINLSQYPPGVYIVNIIADEKRLATKKAVRG